MTERRNIEFLGGLDLSVRALHVETHRCPFSAPRRDSDVAPERVPVVDNRVDRARYDFSNFKSTYPLTALRAAQRRAAEQVRLSAPRALPQNTVWKCCWSKTRSTCQ